MERGEVEIISTSGTTEDRLQLLWEWTWWDPQERAAMRLNGTIGKAMLAARFSEAVLTTPVCGGALCHIGDVSREDRTVDGMLFLNQTQDPSHWSDAELGRMIEEWNELAPEGVEADPAYLAALCRHAAKLGRTLHSPTYVTLTYELPTRAHRRAIAASITSPLYALYGATEAGVLFMECEAGRLHHNAEHSHVELGVVDERDPSLRRVIVTTLGRPWMPLVRYELNDIVRVANGTCACGQPVEGYLLERIEGRRGDCVSGTSGLVTPAMLDDAVDAAGQTVRAWRLERDAGGWTLGAVGEGALAAAALSALLGQKVAARSETAIRPEGSGKYRLVDPGS